MLPQAAQHGRVFRVGPIMDAEREKKRKEDYSGMRGRSVGCV